MMIMNKIQDETVNLLLELGIPANIKGFKFIRSVLEIADSNEDILSSMTKKGGVYDVISDMYNTTPSKVERAIRYAISRIKVPSFYFPSGTSMTNGSVLTVLHYILKRRLQ